MLSRLDEEPAALLAEFSLSAADRAVLEHEVVRRKMRESLRAALAQGIWSWADDDLAFIKPWGFELDEIHAPVRIRYGAGDVLVPAGHGAWLAANVPNACVQVDDDAGHLSTPDDHLGRIRALAAA